MYGRFAARASKLARGTGAPEEKPKVALAPVRTTVEDRHDGHRGSVGWWAVLVAVLGGALRVSTPFLFVSLGECITEKSGRVNLGLEGTLVMGAMERLRGVVLTGSAWLGVLAAGSVGAMLGLLHAWLCALKRVHDIAVGIALMLFGMGLAFFLGKPLIKPTAPRLPVDRPWDLAATARRCARLSKVNVLFLFGSGAGLRHSLRFQAHAHWGLVFAPPARAPTPRARWATT